MLRREPLHTFADVSLGGEEGLMSLALHPDYAENKFLYASYAYQETGREWVKIVRFRDEGNSLSGGEIILGQIPAARFHAGSRIAFGPDEKLYVTTGDATDKNLAQDLDSLAGKILRLNSDGSVPEDNPFPESLVWSYGHRNPQGIAWHPETGLFYQTEHGPSGNDGPAGGDEVNRIEKGKNYGWPLVSHEEETEDAVSPIALFTPAEAPASALIYSGDVFPQFKHNLFFGALKGEGLVRIDLEGNEDGLFIEKIPEVNYGRIREVTEGSDGFIYFSTSNRDGRGNPEERDDRIFRLRPAL
jgi:glucose/arabinose dehydrogenase